MKTFNTFTGIHISKPGIDVSIAHISDHTNAFCRACCRAGILYVSALQLKPIELKLKITTKAK